MKRLLGCLLVGALFLAGCTDQERHAFETKCDASLRESVATVLRGGHDDTLDILGKADGPIDEGRRARLVSAGAEVGTVTGELFTARARAGAVAHIAALDFVTSLQLAQIRDPLKP
jgi:hypothetical protein